MNKIKEAEKEILISNIFKKKNKKNICLLPFALSSSANNFAALSRLLLACLRYKTTPTIKAIFW